MSSIQNEEYRRDIDGLRAIAVLSVLIFHAFPVALSGGFLGVDIFFVISGYLITGILLRSNSAAGSNLSLSSFYSRRIRRIFPALLVVMTFSVIFCWALLLPAEFKEFGKHLFFGSIFLSNFSFWWQSGYFDPSSDLKILLHLWSLAVEEQFYIFWPLILWLGRSKKSFPLFASIVIALASLIYAGKIVRTDPIAAFYSPLARSWEIMAGGVIASLAAASSSIALKIKNFFARHATILSAAGLLLIFFSLVFVSDDIRFLGDWKIPRIPQRITFAAIPVVVGTCCIILSGSGSWLNRKLLGSNWFVFIGLISYPLYLWHWPLLTIAKLSILDSPLVNGAMLLVSVIFAMATVRWIERPIRYASRKSLAVISLSVSMVVIAGVGGAIYLSKGFPSRLPQVLEVINEKPRDPADGWRRGKCFIVEEDGTKNFDQSCIESGSSPQVFLWGDSHAAALYPGLMARQSAVDFSIVQRTTSACPPYYWKSDFCNEKNKENLALVKKLNPQIILLHANWSAYGNYVLGLKDAISAIKSVSSARIIVVGLTPHWRGTLPSVLFISSRIGGSVVPKRLFYGLDKAANEYDEKVKKISMESNVEFISVMDVFCNSAGCLTMLGDQIEDVTTFDYGHISPKASRFLMSAIYKNIF